MGKQGVVGKREGGHHREWVEGYQAMLVIAAADTKGLIDPPY
jgi:hypothetical protein